MRKEFLFVARIRNRKSNSIAECALRNAATNKKNRASATRRQRYLRDKP